MLHLMNTCSLHIEPWCWMRSAEIYLKPDTMNGEHFLSTTHDTYYCSMTWHICTRFEHSFWADKNWNHNQNTHFYLWSRWTNLNELVQVEKMDWVCSFHFMMSVYSESILQSLQPFWSYPAENIFPPERACMYIVLKINPAVHVVVYKVSFC